MDSERFREKALAFLRDKLEEPVLYKVRWNEPLKRAKHIAPGEWLAISPRQAFRGNKDFAPSLYDAYRFTMLMASIRFGMCSEEG